MKEQVIKIYTSYQNISDLSPSEEIECYFIFPALINSMQTDLLAQEKKALKLAAEVDNLRKDARYKEAQLSNMANKVQLCSLFSSSSGI